MKHKMRWSPLKPKQHDSFIRYILDKGGAIAACTHPNMYLRFKIGNTVSTIYRDGNNSITSFVSQSNHGRASCVGGKLIIEGNINPDGCVAYELWDDFAEQWKMDQATRKKKRKELRNQTEVK